MRLWAKNPQPEKAVKERKKKQKSAKKENNRIID
jgi:hypothetical protein